MIKKIINLIIVLIIIFAAYFISQVYFPLSSDGEEEVFIIEEGSGVNKISSDLYERDFISNKFIFETYIWLLRSEGKIKAGEHLLRTNMSMQDLADRLISAKNLNRERSITFIEGWNLNNIAVYLEEEGLVSDAESFFALTGEPGSVNTEFYNFGGDYKFLETKPQNLSLEGYIYPDTYRIFKDATVEDILRRALDNFSAKLTPQLFTDVEKSEYTLNEILALASIVEREARSVEDKRMIADIFLKRLQAGMPLQSDATINYITGKKTVQPSLNDTKIDSPYNTYINKGLPPGPICNPSIDSIEAVLYPTPNDYWYFLTTLDDGQVVYSKTHDEHVANKQKYLK